MELAFLVLLLAVVATFLLATVWSVRTGMGPLRALGFGLGILALDLVIAIIVFGLSLQFVGDPADSSDPERAAFQAAILLGFHLVACSMIAAGGVGIGLLLRVHHRAPVGTALMFAGGGLAVLAGPVFVLGLDILRLIFQTVQ